MSPVAEWSLAAQWAGYTQDYFFDKLSKRWQAHTIALYRIHGQSEVVVVQAQQEESERKSKRGGKRR